MTGGVEGHSEGQARRSGGSLGSFYSSTVELELFNYACVQTALAVRSSLTPFRLVGARSPLPSFSLARDVRKCSKQQRHYLKSDNLQYNTLARWVNGTKDSSSKRLMFQALFLFHNFLQT